MTDTPTTPSSPGTGSPPASAATPAAPAVASTPTPSPATTAPPTSTVARPEWLPESFWDKDKNEVKGADLRKQFDDLSAFKAAQDTARLSRPQKPEDFKIELPKDWKAPQGVDFKFNDGDPLLARAREVAVKRGLDQEGFSELLGLYAGAQVADQQTIKTARDAEIAKLGANASARVDAVTTWAKAMVGDEGAAALSQMLVTARHVEAFEGLIKKFTSQGAGSFTQQHRENAPTKISEAEYEKLTPRQKLDYATNFANGQAAA